MAKDIGMTIKETPVSIIEIENPATTASIEIIKDSNKIFINERLSTVELQHKSSLPNSGFTPS